MEKNYFPCKVSDVLGESRKDEIAPKLVQEIAQKMEDIPERFLLKNDKISPAIDPPSNLWNDTLLIDFSLLSSQSLSSSSAQDELSKLHYALSHWGCFQVINHGMTSSFLDELLNVSKQFFALPLEEKLKCSITEDDYFNGYGNSSLISGDTKSLNWNDRLFLKLYPQDFRQIKLWPENPNNFREILGEYSLGMKRMLKVILQAMAHSLKIEEDSFLNLHNEERGVIGIRFGMYPRCPCPDRVYGVHPHSDGSTITILLQDNDVPDEALHILKDDKWYKVPNIPGALFVNAGDFAEIMSNGIFKSVVHRVVPNSKTERVSVASFCVPDFEGEVEPINELISPNKPQLYNKILIQTYIKLFFETYPLGKQVLDTLKI
ncbi:protein SRG1-like [Amaranthus tricolor]|uniref:protein SRG1-like n=1 Tax=Amaranthus tricolor TaxID=29722 RepID=UPI002588A5C2|nr:protein SRG1-like [Amaranthus tricolor]